MTNSIINYSQCWEDSDVLLQALQINRSDKVLSITSGGDNTLAILMRQPKKLNSLDLNPAQTYLLELKLAALKTLNYEKFLQLLGVNNSMERMRIFSDVKSHLSKNAKKWWDLNQTIIGKGIINGGRFEKYLNSFRTYILPFIHSKETIFEFIASPTIQKQTEFYDKHWNTKLWRLYFRLATSRSILKNFARQKGMFKYVKLKKVSDEYLRRFENNLQNVAIINNCYMQYCLVGNSRRSLPQYLDPKKFMLLNKKSFPNLNLISQNIVSHLKNVPDRYYTKYNLSDVFEGLSDTEFITLWEEIVRTAKDGALIVYWDNLLSREIPDHLLSKVKIQEKLQKKLEVKDKVFFYGSFHLVKISK